MRARLRRNSSILMVQQSMPICDRNGNNLLMIAPKDLNDAAAHQIKLEMTEEREDVENIHKCLQNGNAERNGNGVSRDDNKRKRNEQNRDRAKRRHSDEN